MDADATHCFENTIEVPGTPEQVWEAIATGPGTEAWFVGGVDGRALLSARAKRSSTGVASAFATRLANVV
jgi:uncharacterized protein YndB with AHSA1/START domain